MQENRFSENTMEQRSHETSDIWHESLGLEWGIKSHYSPWYYCISSKWKTGDFLTFQIFIHKTVFAFVKNVYILIWKKGEKFQVHDAY